MKQYKVNLSDNVLVEYRIRETLAEYVLGNPPESYPLCSNHPWSDKQILNEGEFEVRRIDPIGMENVNTGKPYAYPVSEKKEAHPADASVLNDFYNRKVFVPTPAESQEELWNNVYDICQWISTRGIAIADLKSKFIITKKEGK